MTADSKHIVELRLPSGIPFRRSAPMSLLEAEAVADRYRSVGITFTAAVVPAEKYAGRKGLPVETETERRQGYRSKVE